MITECSFPSSWQSTNNLSMGISMREGNKPKSLCVSGLLQTLMIFSYMHLIKSQCLQKPKSLFSFHAVCSFVHPDKPILILVVGV